MSMVILAACLGIFQMASDSLLLSYIDRAELDRGFRSKSIFLVMPVQLGGCNKCIALNDNAKNIALGCIPAKSELVVIQLVPVERQIEFSTIQKQYPYVNSIYPDIRRKFTLQYFSGVNACEAIVIRNGKVVKIVDKSDQEQVCRAIKGQ